MAKDIDKQLSHARCENDKLGDLMGAIGVNPRPTVAQWLQRKQLQRKAKLQDSLISWDTSELEGHWLGQRGRRISMDGHACIESVGSAKNDVTQSTVEFNL